MHDLTAFTIGLPEKLRSGDCFVHFELPEQGLVVAAVADGVGSHACDWAASRAACDAIRPAFTGQSDRAVEDKVARAVDMAHDAVQSLRGEAAGALSTLVLAAWRPAESVCWYASAGDSRLYRVGAKLLDQLTRDDVFDKVVKRDGHAILQAGAVASRRGVTRVLGQPGPLGSEVGKVELSPGELLALVTDGCHEIPGFVDRLAATQDHQDLASAAERLLATLCRDQARDDATAILMREEACPESIRAAVREALGSADNLQGTGVCGHLMIVPVLDEMVRAAAGSDLGAVQKGLDALVAAGLRPRRQEALRVVAAFVDDGRAETISAYRRIVQWVAGL